MTAGTPRIARAPGRGNPLAAAVELESCAEPKEFDRLLADPLGDGLGDSERGSEGL